MLSFINKIKDKAKPSHCDFCGAKIVKRPVTAEVKTPPYMLNFCCYGCKIGYLTLGKSESSISNLIINDLALSGRMPVFQKERERQTQAYSVIESKNDERQISFGIKGITCSSCIPVIEKALELQNNVKSAKINPVTHSVTLNLGKDGADIKSVRRILKKLGYSISEYDNSYDNLKEESYSLLARFAFGVFMSMNIMIFSLLLYSDYFLRLKNKIINYSHIILWAFTTAIVLVVGYPIFKSAYKKLISLAYNSDTLISMGVLSAYIYSSFITFGLYKKSSGVFFDTAAMILILITFGKFLEASAKKSSVSGLHNLINLRPNLAVVLINGGEQEVDIKDIKKDDILIIKRGEPIPADGVLISEYAVIDESMYNGETLPVNKKINENLISGSINKGEDIKIKASTGAYGSYLFKIIRFVERAYNMKIEPLRYIDGIARIFVPVIIAVAVLTFAIYYFLTKNLDTSLARFISVLVVACPCAFGLAAPLVITNGISRAQKDKILVNGAETLELFTNADTFIFDKTGTLTEGLPEIKETVPLNSTKDKIAGLIQVASLIERDIDDRIAEAFKRKAENAERIEANDISGIKFKIGYGVSAKYLNDEVLLGNPEFLKENGIPLSAEIKKRALEFEKEGAAVVYLSIGREPKCFFVITDKIKNGSRDAIKNILRLKKRVIMLSGDSEEAVNFIASEVGITKENAHFRMKPEDKLEFVQNLKKKDKGGIIVFVGDGLNDVPAMEEADISILSPSRYEIPFNRSNVVLADSDLKSIPNLIKLSMEVRRIVKENLLFSFIYNFIAIPLAIFGILNPLSAAISMMVSSIFITFNSLKIKLHRTGPAAVKRTDADTESGIAAYENALIK
ncbi:MAG: heavy metal translocating P-type ATPase [Deltaproteobacteria bacterium]|nr:heavy metal translocating P-type ATPase [Deltaproteobacteria bacterium]MCL5892570.1 heavy metal translocating P-type ATPase [Deltaproteobacteria bacterium]